MSTTGPHLVLDFSHAFTAHCATEAAASVTSLPEEGEHDKCQPSLTAHGVLSPREPADP